MKDPENINELIQLQPDFIGFIFYPKSPRYASTLNKELINTIPHTISKVGVFVNEDFEQILLKRDKYELDYIQLHGDEDLTLVKKLKERGMKVIKVFRISDELPYEIATYDGIADLFLFDKADARYGGTGQQFDWSVLKTYQLKTPYLLSGGVGLEDVNAIKRMDLPMIYGIDVNSRFEIEPGVKDVLNVSKLKEQL